MVLTYYSPIPKYEQRSILNRRKVLLNIQMYNKILLMRGHVLPLPPTNRQTHTDRTESYLTSVCLYLPLTLSTHFFR